MDQASSDHIPVSSIVLFASILFALTAYGTFKVLWKIQIPIWFLLAVLAFQFSAWLLGNSKILTQLGAASLSALIAMIACLAAVFLLFPALPELRIAGASGGGIAVVFILASFVAASRADPVSSGKPKPLDLGDIEVKPTAELIRYGEVRENDTVANQGQIADYSEEEKEVTEDKTPKESSPGPSLSEDREYEFDELSESRLEIALGVPEDESPPDILDLEGEDIARLLEGEQPEEAFMEEEPVLEPGPVEEQAFPDDWVEETARYMAYEVPEDEREGDRGEEHQPARNSPFFTMRTRYKVLDSSSGEHYGTYYGDEGYSTLDPTSLSGLIGSRLPEGELSIVKLDWSNFDEVEVHVRVEEVVPVDLDPDGETGTGELRASPEEEKEPGLEKEPDSPGGASGDLTDGETGEKGEKGIEDPATLRYMIYNRRTIQPMGQFIPEGSRSRIDRLTLYKMFPEYDFKTFEIDSVRWEGDEVRILVKGERKKDPGK